MMTAFGLSKRSASAPSDEFVGFVRWWPIRRHGLPVGGEMWPRVGCDLSIPHLDQDEGKERQAEQPIDIPTVNLSHDVEYRPPKRKQFHGYLHCDGLRRGHDV